MISKISVLAALVGAAAAVPTCPPQLLDSNGFCRPLVVPAPTPVDVSTTLPTPNTDDSGASGITVTLASPVAVSATDLDPNTVPLVPAVVCPLPAAGVDDSAATWLANTVAPPVTTPNGYTQQFSGLQGATQDPQYLTYQQISTYDPNICATACSAIPGCNSFNLYMEFDPSVDPSVNCTKPASTFATTGKNVIKCSYYRSIIDASTATNNGQWRDGFQVAVTASAGYTASNLLTTGYTGNHIPSDMAINAPLNADGSNPLAGMEWWTDGTFSVDRCAQRCNAHTNWVKGTNSGSLCNAFNTYIQTVGGQQQQMCVFYTQPEAYSMAVNGGNAPGTTTVSESFFFTVANYDPSAPAFLPASRQITH